MWSFHLRTAQQSIIKVWLIIRSRVASNQNQATNISDQKFWSPSQLDGNNYTSTGSDSRHLIFLVRRRKLHGNNNNIILNEARSSTRTWPRSYGLNSYFSCALQIAFLLAKVNQAPSPALRISNMVSYIQREPYGSHRSTIFLISFNWQ